MPRVTVNIIAPNHAMDQELVTLDVPPGLTVADFKGFITAETSIPQTSQKFYLNNQPILGDQKTLEEAGVSDGDMMAMLVADETPQPAAASSQRQQQQQRPSAQANAPATQITSPAEIEATRLGLLSHPPTLAQVRQDRPLLAEAINDPNRFHQIWMDMLREDQDRERDRREQMRLLNEDPFNIEAQRKIEEIIREQSVQENLQYAYEHSPEVFGRVQMLYIPVEVNHHPVKAFVDSGAQTTIMSPSCAEACGIMRLIDKRYSGIARGVGTAKILGRVHAAALRIGTADVTCSFTVMEGKDVDLLLGLDMLKRYQACIDLRQNKLIFGNGNEVEFLGEADIPKHMDEAVRNEPTITTPFGTEIGTESGTVGPSGSFPAGPSSSGQQQQQPPRR